MKQVQLVKAPPPTSPTPPNNVTNTTNNVTITNVTTVFAASGYQHQSATIVKRDSRFFFLHFLASPKPRGLLVAALIRPVIVQSEARIRFFFF